MLVLRTCKKDLKSHNDFQWPEKGPVSAPDWKPVVDCGNGLHGLAWGEGNGDLLNWNPDAKWLVVDVPDDLVIDLRGKVKFPCGNVVFCGDQLGATNYIAANGTSGKSIVGYKATAGYGGTATAGYGGTATAGYGGTATAGNRGTATAGYGGTATAGYGGTATAGYGGTATAGYGGTATAGYGGTATAGNRGTATAGNRGTATAGDSGTIEIAYYDFAASRYRRKIGYIGEEGLLAGVKYRLDEQQKFVAISMPKPEGKISLASSYSDFARSIGISLSLPSYTFLANNV